MALGAVGLVTVVVGFLGCVVVEVAGLFTTVVGFLGWVVDVVGLLATVAGFLGWLTAGVDCLDFGVAVVVGFVEGVNGFGI